MHNIVETWSTNDYKLYEYVKHNIAVVKLVVWIYFWKAGKTTDGFIYIYYSTQDYLQTFPFDNEQESYYMELQVQEKRY